MLPSSNLSENGRVFMKSLDRIIEKTVTGSLLESVNSQPEDEDETLQMSLSSHGCSLGDVYPSMVKRIERAWHTQNVSLAADSVLRKYRRWRQQPPRSLLNSTYDVTMRSSSPSNHQNRSNLVPAQALCRLEEGPAHLEREKPPILVMDFSELSKPAETLMNETFIMLSPEKPVSTYSFSLPQPSPKSPLIKASLLTLPVESRRKERPEIYTSPVRQSPLKDRKTSLISFSRKFEENASDRSSTEVRLASPASPLRSFHPERLHQPPPYSPRSSGRPRFRRHLSFDSSQPQSRASFSPQKIDEDFLKLYHKFVCQNKMASSNAPPCRLCIRSSVASRCHSSSALAALALSPHRPIFRKRQWELGSDASPQFKRLREESSSFSPGSKHHRGETLRRWSQSPSKRGSPQDAGPFFAANRCSPLKLFY
ncbi:hypothetical protein FQA47_009867 [Oryzias melastigma]|uniref:Uncharacterized protein n=1 Tax=Oryzias melastigma TaxID=30732 RepID=A0A834FFK4_ORYME|nr:hypothetical protein FQA47_009867 [Oryzias melastigma]